MKASFSSGFEKQQLADGRAPMACKFNTGDCVLQFEMSYPRQHAWKLWRFMVMLTDDRDPEEAFDESFRNPITQVVVTKDQRGSVSESTTNE